jgi:hypothetical protein
MATTPPRQHARLPVRALKINTLISPDALPPDLVPPEPAPAGDPVLDLALEGSPLVVRAKLNGKSYRRALALGSNGTGNWNKIVIRRVFPGLRGRNRAVLPRSPPELDYKPTYTRSSGLDLSHLLLTESRLIAAARSAEFGR